MTDNYDLTFPMIRTSDRLKGCPFHTGTIIEVRKFLEDDRRLVLWKTNRGLIKETLVDQTTVFLMWNNQRLKNQIVSVRIKEDRLHVITRKEEKSYVLSNEVPK